MNLTDQINELPRRSRHPNQCKTCWELEQADDETKQAVNAALAEGAAVGALGKVLARNGYDVSGDNLAKHHLKGHTL